MKQAITIEAIRAAKPATIYYGSKTAWWTHDPEDLKITPPLPENFRPEGARADYGAGMPCGASGEMLYEMHDPEKWISMAEAKPEHFGRHGLEAFMASHAQNCDGVYSANWEAYNNLIDLKNETI